ncbi:MAG TPA: hypothetical protein VGJ20_38380 [Xanthobacteraceae bacterium]|jgi:hypothetical protein
MPVPAPGDWQYGALLPPLKPLPLLPYKQSAEKTRWREKEAETNGKEGKNKEHCRNFHANVSCQLPVVLDGAVWV